MACACIDKLQSLCLRLKGAMCRRRSRMSNVNRHSLKISEPFDFKHVSEIPKGFDEDEMNAFCERAAASRMVAMEDQPSTRPSSSNQHAGGMTFYSHGRVNGGLASGAQVGAGRPQQVKSRPGYRGLASSSAVNASRNGSLAYASPSESRPSLTHSFAATVDSCTPLAPTTSYTTSSSASIFAAGGREGRSFSSMN